MEKDEAVHFVHAAEFGATMRAVVFVAPGKLELRDVPRPTAGPGDAIIRVTLTTICGTDVHILKGEYPVRSGLVIGHEPVGVITELGAGVTGYEIGDRVLVGAQAAPVVDQPADDDRREHGQGQHVAPAQARAHHLGHPPSTP
jgi:threonine dehydrogenase-like Zn-dependent dehydrogenase